VGFEVIFHAVNPAHLGSAHLAQIPQHLIMYQQFAKLHDLNMDVFHLPELSFPVDSWKKDTEGV
jgi:hypothetical protein